VVCHAEKLCAIRKMSEQHLRISLVVWRSKKERPWKHLPRPSFKNKKGRGRETPTALKNQLISQASPAIPRKKVRQHHQHPASVVTD
jgi:hypothetical protein